VRLDVIAPPFVYKNEGNDKEIICKQIIVPPPRYIFIGIQKKSFSVFGIYNDLRI
jgi:hypothetical protein